VRNRSTQFPQGDDLLAAIWTLRLLLNDAPQRENFYGTNELDAETAKFVGVRTSPRTKWSVVRKRLRARLSKLEALELNRESGVLRNADVLARWLRLTSLERDLLILAVMKENVPALGSLLNGLGLDALSMTSRAAACAFGVASADVKSALRSDRPLRRHKLLEVRTDSRAGIVAGEVVMDVLGSTGMSARALVRHFLRESLPTRLSLADFVHVEDDATAIVRLVKGALARRAKGVNILLHGKPGTGKTELARVVASAVGVCLYEVADADGDGDPLGGGRRLAMCAIAHRILGRTKRALLVFDEIEDAFPSRWHGSLGLERGSTPSKSWTHRLLEEAPLPTFWIANEIQQIEPATLRRFDLVIELRVPPQAVRRRMITLELGPVTMSDCHLDRLAADERLAPAHVSSAVRVSNLMGAREANDMERSLAYVLDRKLAAQGSARPLAAAAPGCGAYDLAFVNASADLETLTTSLGRASQAAICLYGPPGTGKTAWVAHLAASLGRPLRAARASDVMDCWVGGTEKNLAALFRSAAEEKALLFLDEADSFLRDRSRARQSWEVTQVNELLVQMETFHGVFVCATNLVDSLDQASLRRFSLKVEFLPLRVEQRWAMFLRLPGAAATAERVCRAAVERLEGVTAGDYATVARQTRLVGAENGPEVLVGMLERELLLRSGGVRRAIGFG
jgi:transitional endoplasmic reticulum ATPase